MSPPLRYRWVVLGVGSLGAGAFAALRMGLPALGPALRDAYALSLSQVGLVFAAVSVGVMVTLIAWGMLTDRIGERIVLTAGLAGTAGALVGAAFAPSLGWLLVGLFAAGAMGASATGASGRAVMGWFGRRERGFALGIRQMALPFGGGLASLGLPLLVGAGGLRAAFLALAGLSLTAAGAAALWLREPPAAAAAVAPGFTAPPPLRDPRAWRLAWGSALLVVAQSSLLGFLVLFLHDERGLSVETAAAGLALAQFGGAFARVAAGRVSDREERRVAPLRRTALADAVLLGVAAALVNAPGALLYPVLLGAAVMTMSWNGLAFTAAAELSGRARAGTAMSFQNTIVAIGGAVSPIAFGALVDASSWSLAWATIALAPLAAFALLGPLEPEEDGRARARQRRLQTTTADLGEAA